MQPRATPQEIEQAARTLRLKYPTGFLSEVYDLDGYQGFGICIRVPDACGLDWPKVRIEGMYSEITAFERAWIAAPTIPALSIAQIEGYHPIEA